MLQWTASREHRDEDTSRNFVSRVLDVSLRIRVEQRSTLSEHERHSGRCKADILPRIGSRLSDFICLIELFEHGIFRGYGSRTSRVRPMSGFEEGIVLWSDHVLLYGHVLRSRPSLA